MKRLRQQLPPLDYLIAFESAARLLSFTAAARELALTQAAISQQIRKLEQRLGAPLLHGDGAWPGFEAERIFPEEVFPVCSPGYLAGNPEIATPEGLAAALLL